MEHTLLRSCYLSFFVTVILIVKFQFLLILFLFCSTSFPSCQWKSMKRTSANDNVRFLYTNYTFWKWFRTCLEYIFVRETYVRIPNEVFRRKNTTICIGKWEISLYNIVQDIGNHKWNQKELNLIKMCLFLKAECVKTLDSNFSFHFIWNPTFQTSAEKHEEIHTIY